MVVIAPFKWKDGGKHSLSLFGFFFFPVKNCGSYFKKKHVVATEVGEGRAGELRMGITALDEKERVG